MMMSGIKACDMSEVSEYSRDKAPNLHSRPFKYSLPDLHKSLLPLKLGICLHSHVPEFIKLKNSLPNSPDFNSVDYALWRHCSRWHGHKISVTDQLKRVLIECWAPLILNTLTPAIDQLPKTLTMVMYAEGAQLPMLNFIQSKLTTSKYWI